MNRYKSWINGKIYTVNSQREWAEAIVTFDNKIVFVGSNEEALNLTGSNVEIHDFGGRLVLPGFIDSHAHLMMGGLSLTRLNLLEVKNKKQFQKAVKEYELKNNFDWLLGGNWNHLQFEEKELPNKKWLDEIISDKPVYLTRIDIHTALVNSKTLELAEISKDTPDPEGGKILKDSHTGEPTGILKDKAMELVTSLIPEPDYYHFQLALNEALKEAKKNGITSIHNITNEKFFDVYQDFLKKDKLTVRLNCIHPIYEVDNFINLGIKHSFGNNNLKIGSLKAFADGSLGSNTAWFFEPYKDDSSTCGLPTQYMETSKFEEWAIKADLNKIQIAVHAIGDRAVSEVLDVFEKITDQNPEWDRRFRIEHVQHIKEKDIERMKKLNVIASMQPAQLYDDGVWAVEKIGTERLKGTHAVKTLMDNNINVCLGSDWTVTPLNVIHGIDIAVNRKTKDGKNPNGWIPQEKISVDEAVRAYTLGAAYASFDEQIKGSIEEEKLADFIVLSKNIFDVDKNEIGETSIVSTILGGEIIYSQE